MIIRVRIAVAAMGFALAAMGLALAAGGASAAGDAGEAESAPRLGAQTHQPLPRFVSLNVDKVNVRRGPGVSHRIDWVFLRRGAPLEVVAEHGHWRKVRDMDDAEGWVHHAMLRPTRTAVVIAAPDATIRRDPAPDAAPVARLETGVTGRLRACGPLWCQIDAGGYRGWAQKADLWGVRRDEEFR